MEHAPLSAPHDAKGGLRTIQGYPMILDTWLALNGMTITEFGRLVGIRTRSYAACWLQLKRGKPNKGYRLPSRRNQFKIRKITNGHVTLNVWPDPLRHEE
jgi:hypothetical protein